MRKYLLITTILGALVCNLATAQVRLGIGVDPMPGYGPSGGRYGSPYPGRRQQKRQKAPKFDPVVHFSLGYGYPNLDQNQLAGFYNYYKGNITQTGPLTGALDFQYSKTASLGVMVTHGQVSTSYYDYNNPSGPPVLAGSLDNWSVMLNLMNYIPTSGKIDPYFRTAIGINIWKQNYTDASGNKLGLVSDPNQFAYQVGLGAKFHLTKNTSFFMEAGYGKYILHGGLSFKL